MARWLGIDIATDALRGAVIRTALRKTEIERYVEIPLNAAEGSPGRTAELTEAARNLLAAISFTPDGIVAALGGEDVSLRVVDLPASARKRVAEVLPFELETLLPYDPRDAVIDHQPVSDDASGIRLLVAAVRRDKVSSEIERLRNIGLDPRELGAGAAALDGLAHVVPALKSEQPILLIDLADHRIDVCALVAGRCASARTIGIGMLDMPGAADEAAHELHRTLAAFRTSGVGAPSAIYFSGSGTTGEGIEAWLAEVLGQPVRPLPLPDALSGRAPSAPTCAKALALAARAAHGGPRIDLRTGEFAAQSSSGQLAAQLNLMVLGAVVVVMTAMFSLKAQQSMLVDEQNVLSEELSSVTKEVLGEAITDPLLVEARVKNPKNTDPLPRFDAYDALASLSGAITPGISHEVKRLRIDIADDKAEGRFELQGAIDSLGQRDEIVAALQKHPCFKDIELGRTNTVAGTEQRVAYQLEAKLHCPGDVGEGAKKKKSKSTEGGE